MVFPQQWVPACGFPAGGMASRYPHKPQCPCFRQEPESKGIGSLFFVAVILELSCAYKDMSKVLYFKTSGTVIHTLRQPGVWQPQRQPA